MACEGKGSAFAAILETVAVTENDFSSAFHCGHYEVKVLDIVSKGICAVLLDNLDGRGGVVVLEFDKNEGAGFAVDAGFHGNADDCPV